MIEIICIRGSGDKEAPSINDPLITTIPIAVQRGKHFIDENWYKVHKKSILVPYKDDCYIANIVEVVEGNLGIDAKHQIVEHNIKITAGGIWSTISVETYVPGEEI
jgi:predicted ATP-dependent Lon-type protease